MPATKDEVVNALRESHEEIKLVAGSLSEAAWSTGVYESGWNAKQLLCHISENPGVAGFLIDMAEAPAGGGGMPADFDLDAFNGMRVASLEAKSIAELLDYLGSNTDRETAKIEAASTDVLSKRIKPPWDVDEGPVADVIIESIQNHTSVHLADLRSAAS